MEIEKYQVDEHNHRLETGHKHKLEAVVAGIPGVNGILKKLADFQIAIPSWALGTGGTRFGRFSGG